MAFRVALQTNPPARRVLAPASHAHANGSSHLCVFDSPVATEHQRPQSGSN